MYLMTYLDQDKVRHQSGHQGVNLTHPHLNLRRYVTEREPNTETKQNGLMEHAQLYINTARHERFQDTFGRERI